MISLFTKNKDIKKLINNELFINEKILKSIKRILIKNVSYEDQIKIILVIETFLLYLIIII